MAKTKSLSKESGSKPKKVSMFRGERKTVYDGAIRNETIDIIAVDESGHFPKKGCPPETGNENMIVVATRIKDRGRYKKTHTLFPKNKKKVKYNNTRPSDSKKILKDVSGQDIAIFERHAPFTNLQDDTPESKIKFYVSLVRDAVNDAVDHDPGCYVDVLIDTPPVEADTELERLCMDLTERYGNIEWFETGISESNMILKVNDFPTGAAADSVRKREDRREIYVIIEPKMKK